jgi:hypothetical protein
MADDSSTGIVAVLVVFVMVIVGGFLAVRSGLIGGETKSVDVDVTAPAAPAPAAPAAPKNP